MTIKLQNGGLIIDPDDSDNLLSTFLKFLENSDIHHSNLNSSSSFIFQLKLNESFAESPYSKFKINLFNNPNAKINNLLVKIAITSNMEQDFTAIVPFPNIHNSSEVNQFHKIIYNQTQFSEECIAQQQIFVKTAINSVIKNPSVKSDWNGTPIDINLLSNPTIDPATPGLLFYTDSKNDISDYSNIQSTDISLSEFIFFQILSKLFNQLSQQDILKIIQNIKSSALQQYQKYLSYNSINPEFANIQIRILVTEYIDTTNFLDLANISQKFYIPLSSFFLKSINQINSIQLSQLEESIKQTKINSIKKTINNANLYAKQIRTWSQVTLLYQFLRIIRDTGYVHFDLHLSNALCTYSDTPYIDTDSWTQEQWEYFPNSIDTQKFNVEDLYKVKSFNSSSDINKLWPQFIYLKPMIIDWANHYKLSKKEQEEFNRLYDLFTDDITASPINLPKPDFNDNKNTYFQTKFIIYLNDLLFFIFKICKDNYAKCDNTGDVTEWHGSFNPPPSESVSTKERFIPKISIANRNFDIASQPFYQENIDRKDVITRETLLQDSFAWINKNINQTDLQQIQMKETTIMKKNLWQSTYPFTYLQCLICLSYNIAQAFMLTNLTNVNPMKSCRTVINTLWNVFCPKLFFIDDPDLNLLNIGLFTNITEAGISNDELYNEYRDSINIPNPPFPQNSIKDVERKEIIGGYDFSGQLQKMPTLTNDGQPNLVILQKNPIAQKFWFKQRYSSESSLKEVQSLCKNSISEWSTNFFLFESPISKYSNYKNSSEIIFKNGKFQFKKNGPKEDTLNGLYALSIYFHARIKQVEKDIKSIEESPYKIQDYQTAIERFLKIGNDLPEANQIIQEQSQREYYQQQKELSKGNKPIITAKDKSPTDFFTETHKAIVGDKYDTQVKKVKSAYDALDDEKKTNINNSIETIKGLIGGLFKR